MTKQYLLIEEGTNEGLVTAIRTAGYTDSYGLRSLKGSLDGRLGLTAGSEPWGRGL